MKKRILIIALISGIFLLGPHVPAQEKPTSGEKPISVLLYFGVYTNFYRIEEALEPIAGHKLKIANARTDGADFIPALEEFPMFDVIVMSNVNYDSLKEFGLGVIDSFVKGGGGLLVLGGPFTYGQGGYEDTAFPAMLPIEKPEPFDLKWEKEGVFFSPGSGCDVLGDIDLSSKPYVYWIHEARPKEKSIVVLKAGERPLLVLGQHGKGRVGAFLGTPLGEPLEGQTPFWESPEWPALMRITLTRLAGGKTAPVKEETKMKEVPVFSEDFDKVPPGTGLPGWIVKNPKGAVFEVTPEHNLKIIHTTVDHSKDRIIHKVKSVKKGALEFDVKLGGLNNDYFTLRVMIAGKLTSFCRNLWRAHDGGGKWTNIGSLEYDKWHKCRAEFDFASKLPTIKFFIDGKQTGTAAAGKDATEFNEINFQDYGLAGATVTNCIDNIKLFEFVQSEQ